MQTATIQVAYVNPPKPGKKQGSVKDAEGNIYGVWPDKLHLFEPGNVYTIEYTSRDFNGQQYHDFKKMVEAQAKPNGYAAATNGHDKSCDIFTTGVIQQTLRGVGTLPEEEVLTEWIRRCIRSWKSGHEEEVPY